MWYESKLCINKKECIFLALFFVLIFLFSIGIEYHNYKKLKSKNIALIEAKVIFQYQKISKNSKKYHVLKLKSDGFTFYTTTYEDIKDLTNRQIELKIVTKDIDFLKFLKGFYAPSFDIALFEYKESFKDYLQSLISDMHKDQIAKELYLALYLAKPISKSLRKKVSYLGINHLIAISGYHLGVISFFLWLVLRYPYMFFQDRFFPYRDQKLDITIFVTIVLFLYGTLCDWTPSLLRSFVMIFFGAIFYFRAVKIVSFQTLFITVAFLISLFPRLMFSISFWLSVAGVFYIFLFLKHFSKLDKIYQFILLYFWIYLAIQPIVKYLFGSFCIYELFSPLLSFAFLLFYPSSILAHFFSQGDIFDKVIKALLSIDCNTKEIRLNNLFLAIYIAFSILSINKKRFFYIVLFYSISFLLYMIIW